MVLTWWLWGSETLTHPEAKGVPNTCHPVTLVSPSTGGQQARSMGAPGEPGNAWAGHREGTSLVSAPRVIQQGLAPPHVPSSNGGRQTASLGAV